MIITALLIFPCVAILWLMLCERLGMVKDEPPVKYLEDTRPVVSSKLHKPGQVSIMSEAAVVGKDSGPV